MSKRGQTSVFVIVGIVVVAVIGLLLTFSSNLNLNLSEQATVEDVNDYMESCVKDIIFTSVGDDRFSGSADNAKAFLTDYIKQNIRTNCEIGIDENFNNVEKPSEIFVEVDIKEVDLSGWQVKPADHVYEMVTVRINYDAKVNIEGNKFTLKPILVEYEF